MPCPDTALTSTHCTCPPDCSSGIPAEMSCVRTRSGSAPGASHLVIATT